MDTRPRPYRRIALQLHARPSAPSEALPDSTRAHEGATCTHSGRSCTHASCVARNEAVVQAEVNWVVADTRTVYGCGGCYER